MKYLIVIAAAVMLAVGASGTVFAFHSGGVAECTGCHSMHSPKAGGSMLLVGTDASSTCLTCHENPATGSYHISTPGSALGTGMAPINRTPGGDFGWLKKTYTFSVRGTPTKELGDSHGHNIVAADYAYVADATNKTAPGGKFSAADLACNSCHDQHGKYRRLNDGSIANTGLPIKASGSYTDPTTNEPDSSNAVGVYRLLAGIGYSTTVSGSIDYPGVPAAKVPSTYNQTEATNQVRVAYGVGTSKGSTTWGHWCGTCHGTMHSTGNYVHKTDEGLGGTTAANYNAYVKSGDLTGVVASSFSSLAPFATNSGDYTALAKLATNTGTSAGPGSSDQVTCVSCHRAHATGFPEMLRFSMENEFMVKNAVYQVTERGRTSAEALAAYYDRPVTQFATYQRVFCNKCHAKD